MSIVTAQKTMERAAISRPAFARDATWLLAFPLVAVLLLAIAFKAALLTAGQVSAVETGTCAQYSRTAAIYQMIMLH